MSGVLDGMRVLVTGSGRGLGRSIAIGLADAGADVWITARTAAEVERTADAIRGRGGRVTSLLADLADSAACARLAADVGPDLDVLINNAAVLDLLPLEALMPETWARAIAVNLTAPYLLTRSWLAPMRTRGGSIINVSSRAGALPFANESAYCASKFGLEGFTRAVALELAGAPVSINTVTPGLRIKPTSISDEAAAERNDPAWQDAAALVPAFVWLALDRGRVSGLRFDAQRLASALAANSTLTADRVRELAEPMAAEAPVRP